jgi:hypothetical protein
MAVNLLAVAVVQMTIQEHQVVAEQAKQVEQVQPVAGVLDQPQLVMVVEEKATQKLVIF